MSPTGGVLDTREDSLVSAPRARWAGAGQVGAAAPGAAIAGLYTYGEIGRIRGVNALHSQTIVTMALA